MTSEEALKHVENTGHNEWELIREGNMKKWYHSKTLVVNGLVVIGCLISGITGKNWFDGEAQLMVISIIDFILRLRTNQGLTL